jgi:UDP-glucose 4-epimerase
MKVSITGVAGFLGSHMADHFLAEGWDVSGVDNLLGGYETNVPDGVEFFSVDATEPGNLHDAFKGADLVLNTACTAYEGLSVFSPALIVKNTSLLVASVMSASVKSGVSKVVQYSSMARYGTQSTLPYTEDMTPMPQDPYGISKYEAERLVANIATTHGLEYTIMVPHNIIGPRQKYDDPYRNVASIMTNRMLQGKQPIIYGDGTQQRCFSFVQDVINPSALAATSDVANGKVVNIGPDDETITINELAVKLADIIGFDLEPIYMPGRPQEVYRAECSADLARELLGYKTTTSLDDGLKQLVTWIDSEGVRPFSYHLPLEFTTDKTPKTWSEKLM